MKKIFPAIILILFGFLLNACSSASTEQVVLGKKFSFEPEKPLKSGTISVFYNSDGTILDDADSVDMIVYNYASDIITAEQFPMKKYGNGWMADFIPADSALGIVIIFQDHNNDEFVDNNSKKGYSVFIYDKNGQTVPGALAGYAIALNTWGTYYAGLDRDDKTAMNYFNEDFSVHSEIRNNFMEGYLATVSRLYPAKADSIISINLTEFEKSNPTSEDDLILLSGWYGKIKNTIKQDVYKKEIQEKFPKGKFVQSQRFNEFYNEKDINKKLDLAKKFEENFPKSEYISSIYDLIANYYVSVKDYNSAVNFLKKNSDKPSTYRFYYVANQMVLDSIDLSDAAGLAKIGIDRCRNEINGTDNNQEKKPDWETAQQWQNDKNYYLGLNLFALGNALYKSGKINDAIPALAEAYKLTKQNESGLNDVYVKALNETKNYNKVYEVVSELMKKGKESPEMENFLKTAYSSLNKSTPDFDNYVAELKDQAKKRLIKKLKSEMVTEPAPDFSLKDLNGKEINLSSLRGKTVVIDFWATWCGPCKASFPGMKKIVDKFANVDSIKFLFINSWERVPNIKQNAIDFINKNDYPFEVLLDTDNNVITNYKVSGIPTKFFVDKNGKIRYVSVGFSGNTDEMVEEVSTLISLLN